MKILWWARLGKLLTLIAAAVIVVDLVGPERIQAWANRRAEKPKKRLAGIDLTVQERAVTLLTIPLVVALTVLVYCDAPRIVLVSGISLLTGVIVTSFGRVVLLFAAIWVYGHDRTVKTIKLLSFVVLLFGFALDGLGA
ncbi:putative Tic20 family protein [Actinokineospora baliensis]|uniref:hypothetical protein n=1 Tax=Actinokineospora baliensis TaxID=547056 RepID=UPI00195856B1|nr:hypothetical protein [Actinokineospora baliensis]MBM7771976.1 putative Tic20 family protein [Actinokineospora baliensis]